MTRKMPLAERIAKLRDVLEREEARYAKESAATFQAYAWVLQDVLPELSPHMTRNDVVELLGSISIQIESQKQRIDYSLDEPDATEVYERAVMTQYKRLFYQIENLLKGLPRDKEYGDR